MTPHETVMSIRDFSISPLLHAPDSVRRYGTATVWLLVAACGIAGCASQLVGDAALLQFLEPARTTRSEVISRLDEPYSEYRQDRVIIYLLDRDEGGYLIVPPDGRVGCCQRYPTLHLVLEFDEAGRLKRHALVDVGVESSK